MRCPFCHNPELVALNAGYDPVITDADFFKFLDKRKNIVEGVCITGGEPLLYGELLLDFIKEIKSRGYKVKLDTNGSFPELLQRAGVDYIAMDIKTSPDKYHMVGYTGDFAEIRASLEYVMHCSLPYELRTTVVPGVVDLGDIEQIAHMIEEADNYVLSQFRSANTLNPLYEYIKPYDAEMLQNMKKICEKHNIRCSIRANYST